ncbi:methionine--tRNA ligase [Iodidimonas sp. SYSU 1G8]|uniref:methionine--tRNA ligase n=1 Tax=Iodidimonas sp. SYSU 1G8 TaxID=3133967 RepID=UPI0031FE55B1
MTKSAFYITTAISYVNGAPHLGHAYEAIATDVIARFKRLDGYDVLFLTGTDEHGEKVEQSAGRAGKRPIEFADENAGKFEAMCKLLEISNDDFIRTTQPRHYAAVEEMWNRMIAKGDIYLDKYAGWYSVSDEAFFPESELVKGEDGTFRTAEGKAVQWVEEPSYFFRLSAYEDRLLDLYEQNPGFILPDTRRNEIVSFVRGGLKDLSVSRTSFTWGIPVPGDDKHIVYVWLDALTNYITGAGFPSDGEKLARYWPADIHVIGKDIIRFHTVYWPAFLMSAELPLPKRVFAHGFLNLEGVKMSKSLGNVITPETLVSEFGLDQIRYFLAREVPFGKDGSFSREGIIHRINGDLANGIGNLAQRTLSMIFKNCDAALPRPGAFDAHDEALFTYIDTTAAHMRAAMEDQEIHNALSALWALVAEGDGYIARTEPWALKKNDPARMATVLYVVAETLRNIAILSQPVIPNAAARLLDMLGVPGDRRDFSWLGAAGRLAPAVPIAQPQGLFPRIVEEPAS